MILSKLKQYRVYFFSLIAPLIVFSLDLGSSYALNQDFMIGDEVLQYERFFRFYQQAFYHFDFSRFIYSFSNGLGLNTFGQTMYYLADPLNLIMLAFPNNLVPVGIIVLSILKVCLMAVAMIWLLRQEYYKLPSFFMIVISAAYALMGWVNFNLENIIWLSGLIYLPILIGFVQRLWYIPTRKDKMLYVLVLCLAIFSNYYIAYMLCLFLILYVLWAKFTYSLHWRQLLNFIFCSIIAVLLCGIFLVPLGFNLVDTRLSVGLAGTSLGNLSVSQVFSQFGTLSSNVLHMANGYPQIYVGLFFYLFLPWYFLNTKIDRIERVASAVVFLILVLSCMFLPLAKFWQGMALPLSSTYRFSFLLSFWVLYLAGRGLIKLDSENYFRTKLGLSLVLWLLLLFSTVMSFILPSQKLTFWLILGINFLFGLVYLGLLLKRWYWLALAFCLYELILAGYFCFHTADHTLSQRFYSDFKQEQVSFTKLKRLDHSWYRVNLISPATTMDTVALNINGANLFSSNISASTVSLAKHLGLNNNKNAISPEEGPNIVNSFLGMKYIYSRHDMDGMVSVTDDVYLNPNALPIGFSITTNKKYQHMEPLDSIFSLYNQATPIAASTWWHRLDVDLASNHDSVSNSRVTLDKTPGIDLATNDVNNIETKDVKGISLVNSMDKTGWVTLTYKFPLRTKHELVFDSSVFIDESGLEYKPSGVLLYINGKQYRSNAEFLGQFKNAISLPNTNQVVVKYKLPKHTSLDLNKVHVYYYDQDIYQQKTKYIQKNGVSLTQKTNLFLKGTFNVGGNNDTLLFTIPFDRGWQLKVDGQSVGMNDFYSDFVTAKLHGKQLIKGVHTFSMVYHLPGLYFGLLSFIVGLLGFYVVVVRPFSNKN